MVEQSPKNRLFPDIFYQRPLSQAVKPRTPINTDNLPPRYPYTWPQHEMNFISFTTRLFFSCFTESYAASKDNKHSREHHHANRWKGIEGYKMMLFFQEKAEAKGTTLGEALRIREDCLSTGEVAFYLGKTQYWVKHKINHYAVPVFPRRRPYPLFIWWWDMWRLTHQPEISRFLEASPWMKWRHSNKYTLFEAARALGMSRRQYMRHEAGERLKSRHAARVLEVLGPAVLLKILAWQKMRLADFTKE